MASDRLGIQLNPQIVALLAERYTIDRELGRGGMATVWLAHDRKHDRPVALKVLRPELAASLGPDRFLAEIRVTARLQHPHIVPLFDSGEAEGILYYVMPYIEGASLRARLEREHRLDVPAMLAIARPVAAALAYAHELGIVHRDIKPENILLCRDQPFVTDFGIARAVSVAGGERLTGTGVAIGTPAYMSPEQAVGEATVDGRSDVYSLGCVIYEMLSGGPPFAGPTVQALIAKRLAGPPPHLTTVSGAVDEVVRRSLATAPQDRFQTAVALADALVAAARKPTAGGPAIEDTRLGIVVLPFDNLSPEPDQEYFCDGMTEEVIADLSSLRSLRVISRTSATLVKASGKDTKAIGRELGVRYALEGSVRKAGDRLRVTAQLIDSVTDAHVWAERYNGEMGDVFTIQENVARSIAEALRLELTLEEDQGLSERLIRDVEAYELYLRARQRTLEWTLGALDRARQELLNGLDVVGPNAPLYAGLAYVYFQYVNMGVENDEYIRKSEEYARQALALDPASGEAHLVMGLLYQAFRGDQRASFRHLRSALKRNPDDPHALLWLIVGHTLVGRTDDAMTLVERIRRVDPLGAITRGVPVFVDVWGGKTQHSPEELRIWHTLDRDSPAALFFAAILLCYEGYRDEAHALLEAHLAPDGSDVFTRAGILLLRALRGNPEKLLEETTTQINVVGCRDPQFSYLLADIHALAGLKDKALAWLENSVDRGFCNHPFMTVHDPLLANIRGTAAFEGIAARAKREWLAFDA